MARVDYDPRELGSDVYALLNAVIIPRPIAWVSTRSSAGVDNLAPHSYFTVCSVKPPVVQFTSVGVKDSLRNVRETGEFVVNVSTRPLVDSVNRTATNFGPDVSEFYAAGLTWEPSEMVAPGRVGESPVALECCLVGERSFGDSVVVFGEVLHISVDAAVLRDGTVAPDLLKPVARLGGSAWAGLGEIIEIDRIRAEDYQPPAGSPAARSTSTATSRSVSSSPA